MTKTSFDPLLGIARVFLITIICLGTLLGAAMIVFGMIELANPGGFMEVHIPEDISTIDYTPQQLAHAMMANGTIMLLRMVCLYFLYQIVGSVKQGDPFTPENAKRLARLGWTLLGTYVLAFVLRLYDGEASMAEIDGPDLGSALVLLIVFILARVFRKGTEIREDLEGTV